MTGAEVIIKALEREGVNTIFGMTGGAIMVVYDAMYDSKINHILMRHEQGATHAADAYYRTTGKVGVTIATSGPGATNLITGLANAMMDSAAIVAITGNVPSGLIGTDAFQEADIYGITGPVTKHNYLVRDVNDLPRVIKEAFHIASTGRPGPVLIDIPKDLQIEEFTGDFDAEMDLPGYKPTIKGHAGQIKKAAEALKLAKKPIMIVGGGSQSAADELLEFVENVDIPVITTLMGIGAFPTAKDQWLGMPGMHGTVAANKAISNCDLILASGIRFDDRVTGKISTFAPEATIIHMDIDPAEISKLVKAHVPVVGDLKNILPRLSEYSERLDIDDWRKQTAAWKAKYPERYNTEKPLVSQEVIGMLRKETTDDCIVTTEVGQHQMFAARLFPTEKPRTFVTSGGLGTMGFGLPAAVGAALGNPGRQVVCIAGDGSIQMNIQELATIYKHQLPIIIAIINNGCLGMVRQWQEMFFSERYAEIYLADSNPDFAKLAEAYGIEGHNIHDRESAKIAIEKASKSNKPVLLNFFVYEAENVFPMVPAGAGVADMIIGDQMPEGDYDDVIYEAEVVK